MKDKFFSFVVLSLLVGLAACTTSQAPKDTTPPAVPSGLTATAGNAQVTLNWQANSEADFKQVNLYQGSSSGQLSKIGSETSSSFTVTGLTNGQTYFFALDAEDNSGNTSAKTTEVAATPSANVSDTTPPSLLSSSPADSATGVALNANIKLSFSEAMNQAATQAAVSINPALACGFSWNAAGDSLTCKPSSNMTASTTYTVTVAVTAQDLAGNALSGSPSFSFTTGTEALATCTFGTSAFNACVFGN